MDPAKSEFAIVEGEGDSQGRDSRARGADALAQPTFPPLPSLRAQRIAEAWCHFAFGVTLCVVVSFPC